MPQLPTGTLRLEKIRSNEDSLTPVIVLVWSLLEAVNSRSNTLESIDTCWESATAGLINDAFHALNHNALFVLPA